MRPPANVEIQVRGGQAGSCRREEHNTRSNLCYGGVPERSKGLAWKASVPSYGTEGSNPSPSAIAESHPCGSAFVVAGPTVSLLTPQLSHGHEHDRLRAR